MIYKTDINCPSKNEFAYFVKFDGKFYCVATTDSQSFWELGELANFQEFELEVIPVDKFLKPAVYNKCKRSLSVNFIESLLKNQK